MPHARDLPGIARQQPRNRQFLERARDLQANQEVERKARPVHEQERERERDGERFREPVVRNVLLKKVTSKKSPRVISTAGTPGSTLENIRLVDCTFRGVEGAAIPTYAGSVSYKNVTVEPAPRARNAAPAEAAR